MILAPSFADIFYNNCFKNGMLPIALDDATTDDLFRRATVERLILTVDLVAQRITAPGGLTIAFEVDPFRRHCLLNGLDDIGLTLENEAKITAYERAHAPA